MHHQTVCVELNESIALRAWETLMAAQSRPLACSLLTARCPQCRVMNYGSSYSALFCRVATSGGDCMWFSAARLIFQHIRRAARRLWCNAEPPATCTWACRWGYMREHAYEGRLNRDFYARVCEQTPGWILDHGESCAVLQFPVLTGAYSWTLLLGSHTHGGVKFGSRPDAHLYPVGGGERPWLGSDPLSCRDSTPPRHPDKSLFHVSSCTSTQHSQIFVTDTMFSHHN